MRRKIPMWVFFVALMIIAGAGYVQDEYGNKNYEREKLLLDRIDSLQRIVDNFDTCYQWKNNN